MTAAEWGKTLIAAGILTIITTALLYWFWPEWIAQRAIAGRLGSLLIMGGCGLFVSVLGAYMRAK